MGAGKFFVRVAVVAGGAILIGCTREVAAGLDEGEANRAVVALTRAGVDVEKVPDSVNEGRFQLVVAREEATTAISVLAGEELPRARPTAPKEGALIASADAERSARIASTAAQIERSLESIDGVLDARVLLDVPAADPLVAMVTAPVLRPTASVLLRHRGATPPIALDDVRRLVAGAVSGLATQDVAVVAVPVAPPLLAADRTLARVGPIAVARGSLGTLRFFALVLLAGFALLGVVVLVLAGRLRRLRDGPPATDPTT